MRLLSVINLYACEDQDYARKILLLTLSLTFSPFGAGVLARLRGRFCGRTTSAGGTTWVLLVGSQSGTTAWNLLPSRCEKRRGQLGRFGGGESERLTVEARG